MKEVLKRFDQLEKKLESEIGGLRADVLSRMAELEMRVTTAHRLARDDRFDALVKRVEALEAKLG